MRRSTGGLATALILLAFTLAWPISRAEAWGSGSWGSYSGDSYGSWDGTNYGGTPTEAQCRVCHEDLKRFPLLKYRNPDKHHLLLGSKIPSPTIAPNGIPGQTYQCLSCHTGQQIGSSFQIDVVRNCLQCHPARTVTGSPRSENVHHRTDTYRQFRCSVCHSDWGGSWGR